VAGERWKRASSTSKLEIVPEAIYTIEEERRREAGTIDVNP
jgi:hypothetical protein